MYNKWSGILGDLHFCDGAVPQLEVDWRWMLKLKWARMSDGFSPWHGGLGHSGGRPLAWVQILHLSLVFKLTLFSSTAASLVFSCPNARAGSLFPSVCSCLYRASISLHTNASLYFGLRWYSATTVFCTGFKIFDVCHSGLYSNFTNSNCNLETIKPYFHVSSPALKQWMKYY